MKPKAKYKIKNIAIIGLGLIGGSLAKALKEKGYKIIGIDINSTTIKLALKEKAINKGYTQLNSKSLENIDLIFICTPLPLIKIYLTKISKLKLKNRVIITDVGSTKEQICRYANKISSPSPLFIGGHPMAGTEYAGFVSSKKDLFKNCAWVLTPTDKNKQSIETLKIIIKKIDAKPIITTPKKHDEAVALISHLPLLVSIGLCETVKESGFMKLALTLASSGFRDTTRIAGGNTEMNSNLLISNQLLLKKLLPKYNTNLGKIISSTKNQKNLYKKISAISKWRNSLFTKH